MHLVLTSLKKPFTPSNILSAVLSSLAVNVLNDVFSTPPLGKLYLPLTALSNTPSLAIQPTFALARFHPITLGYIFTYHADMLNIIRKFLRVRIYITKTSKRK